MNGKKWYLSKTLWVNIIALVVTIAKLMGYDIGIPIDRQEALAGSIVSGVNLFFRLITKQPITL